MARCIFHVDLDAFFVAVEQLHNPSLRGKPVVVGGNPGSRGVVSAASYEARRYGVHSAMPLMQAQRLCPQAFFVPLHFSRYAEASRQFMSLLESMSPLIETLGLDEAFLDMSTILRDFEQARSHAMILKHRVRQELGLTVSVGVATCKTVAKVASDHGKPDGLVLVPPGEERSFLAPLDVRRLPGVGKKTAECLYELGVRTIEDLSILSEEVLRLKIGKYGDTLLRHARGIDTSPVEPHGEPKSISRETTFQADLVDSAFLQSSLHAMCREVAQDLRDHRRRAGAVALKLRYEDFQTVTRQTSLREHTSEAAVIFTAAGALLRTVLLSERRRVRLIGVKALRLSGPERQLDMFSRDAEKLQNFEQAVTELRSRYGPESIRTLRNLQDRSDLFPRST